MTRPWSMWEDIRPSRPDVFEVPPLGAREVPFMVDRHQHRIVKREGVWRMYCPERGTHSLIYTISWSWVLLACQTPCPHDELFYRR